MKYHIRFFKVFLGVLGMFFMASCGKPRLEAYYFPLKKLSEQAKVYEYVVTVQTPTGQTDSIRLYWYYQTIVQGDSINFVGTLYDNRFQVVQLFREQRVNNGMLLKDLTLYGVDSTGRSVSRPADIEQPAVYPFAAIDSHSIFINTVHCTMPAQTDWRSTLTRNRRWIGPTSYVFEGKTYKAMRFKVKEEEAIANAPGGGFTSNYDIEEVYAEGIGLVESRYLNAPIYRKLVAIYTMGDLERRFKQNIHAQ